MVLLGVPVAAASADTISPVLGASLRTLRRASSSSWLLLQQTAAAVIAWLIATEVVGHDTPFFAPIAAVISLNAALGERGSNVLRMLLGVLVGIVVGEITIVVLGVGHGRLAIATFMAMAIARALDASRIVIAQAAAGAILTVATIDGAGVGFSRLTDAFIGGGVALVFTQILFTPDPLRLLRQAEAAGFAAIAENLERVAHALEHDDVALVRRALDSMHDVRNSLVDLERAQRAGPRVRRHSVIWRARRAAVDQETERARRLDLLGASCLLLTRTVVSATAPERRSLAPNVRELAGVIGDLARHLDDPEAHERARRRALVLARLLFHEGRHPPSALAAASLILEIAALDVMSFVGGDRERAIGEMTAPPHPSE